MAELFCKGVQLPTLFLVLLWIHEAIVFVMASEKVYFDKYGHCSRAEPFSLSEDKFKAKHRGGGFSHETLDCSLTFKAAPGYGICVTFDDFRIKDCGVRFQIYSARSSDDEPIWKEMTCYTEEPSQMCTAERYVTLRVLKDRLNRNKGYTFELEIEQSSSVTEEGVVFASIGVVIGIIAAVIVLLIIIALLVYCCCRKKGETSLKQPVTDDDQVQPSAPPMPDAAPMLYPSLQEKPMLDPPPPYDQPPSYSASNFQDS